MPRRGLFMTRREDARDASSQNRRYMPQFIKLFIVEIL